MSYEYIFKYIIIGAPQFSHLMLIEWKESWCSDTVVFKLSCHSAHSASGHMWRCQLICLINIRMIHSCGRDFPVSLRDLGVWRCAGDMGVGKSCLLHQFTEKKCTITVICAHLDYRIYRGQPVVDARLRCCGHATLRRLTRFLQSCRIRRTQLESSSAPGWWRLVARASSS